MKTKKPAMAKITVKALNDLKRRKAKVVQYNRKAIQKIKELSALLNERAYNVSAELVSIPEYEQRLDDYRFKVATMQATIDALQAEVKALTPIELPVGNNPKREFWDKPKESLMKRILKKLGLNG